MNKAITEKEIRKLIGELKESYKHNRDDGRPGHRRFGLRRYLKDIYRVYLDLHSRRTARKTTRKIAKSLRLLCRANAHPIRILIEASAGPEDNRAKSRWTQALKYAHGWLQRSERLKWFFGVNGGIAGAAAKLAIRDGTTRNNKKSEIVSRSFNQQKNVHVESTPKANSQVANCTDRVLKQNDEELQSMFVKLNTVK